ncbi:MAG: glycosyltransferase [Phycisphaeraceae bacterium]|nr:glycosyltransferase [Phycisphaerae bacterium]MBX3393106.1 glycosyltransferase [Phycisphaeraceae bacterium]
MITYVLPTHERHDRLASTLRAIGDLGPHREVGGAEVIIVDNASPTPAVAPGALTSGVFVRVIRLETNEGAAARNAGVEASDPSSDWVVMLDDDSHPVGTRFLSALSSRSSEVAAVMADIRLPRLGTREAGGLPEVFIGCGVAIRRSAFLEMGGYDRSFNYYVEEYDLAARLLLAGYRVEFDPAFRIDHAKDVTNRDMNEILRRLVRNNGWVVQRYAPEDQRRAELREVRGRYRSIARKEGALDGFGRGLVELRRTFRAQRRTPFPRGLYERFTGKAHALEALEAERRQCPFHTAAVVEPGKNAWVVREALAELGVREVDATDDPEVLVIGTMSPGPMIDAAERWSGRSDRWRVAAPWRVVGELMRRPMRLGAA